MIQVKITKDGLNTHQEEKSKPSYPIPKPMFFQIINVIREIKFWRNILD